MNMNISNDTARFIHHFGEMGSRWGINRTVGQIYALLYLSEKPLCADDISELLTFSRSNVSMGLKELDNWQLIRQKHIPGDRKDYFTVPEDIWEILKILARQRKQREIDPTLSLLRDTLLNNEENETSDYACKKMSEMHDLVELVSNWHQDVDKLSTTQLTQLLKLGSKIYKLYEFKNKVISTPKKKIMGK